jgi:hypothetical protein
VALEPIRVTSLRPSEHLSYSFVPNGTPKSVDVGICVGREEELPARLTEFDLRQFFQLTSADIAAIRERFRADRFAAVGLQLVCLRAFGRPLDRFAAVPRNLLQYVCEAFSAPLLSIASLKTLYQRRPTLYEHQQWVKEHLGIKPFDVTSQAALLEMLRVQAAAAADVDELVTTAQRWLYDRCRLIPGQRQITDMARHAFSAYEAQMLTAVTHIGNEHFACFKSTNSKSRINFLELLAAGHGYQINDEAIAYMKERELPQAFLDVLRQHERASFADQSAWLSHLDSLGMDVARHRTIATEGALLGCLKRRGIAQDLAIISDDAGQFNVLVHGLCWVHAERLVHKLLPLNDLHREDIARVRADIWSFYADLKEYKLHPTSQRKCELQERFDAVFIQKTRYATLDRLLRRIHKNKSELLLVLERPEVPLHTNGSERDIRDQVKKQKISGGTRSELGCQCRDTFSSLKKTCRKRGISFWNYLTDRISYTNHIPLLPHILEQRLAISA